RQQKAALVVAHLAQAASMAYGARLDCGFLLPCGHHEKIVNTLLEPVLCHALTLGLHDGYHY
ncbi:MAG: hypothetical protein KGM60_12225, partial [Comamonadaceae bacterium]|nr:hypothetical protein [Comamonadaceae bacterium]